MTDETRVKIFRGKGCDECVGTGFRGRLAIYEILLIDDAIRRLVMKNSPASEIKKAAIKSGMRTLRQDGWLKVMEGMTTPEEILEVAEEDRDTADVAQAAAAADAAQAAVPSPAGAPAHQAHFHTALKTSPERPKVIREHGRFFVRLNTAVNIHYKVIKGPFDKETPADLEKIPQEYSFTKNISAGGLAFVAHEPIAAGSLLEVRIELPGEEEAIECLAKILRVDEIEPGKIYYVAVCFLDLSSAMRSRLDKYVVKELK